ncbi:MULTISPECIES: lipase family protein [unclassified Mycolicibacterium]|uniref:lipase family protein n=1 Tax=unclassified Mycolicibacterium TaxID=2636767 RepID=UPI0012DC0301|nr:MULTISPECIES: lipase family protein [unclassified Mycolicibacterium]MUL82969.1 lipase family protein [Mycolicibacterium sp. CBMA 329]MUL89304.1 lipase family protein [Mycolicibacterium sp. CBMA 331]MUM02771.1 lipase family protein [Mycolicibacterium sp. CBMA 334]MUM28907.1 lipase family protein [Mycolicibacterium sp. CBMA 295]MUM38820.1 lipase family protein [Mycolicibacterium sp. CBMA 247]
MSFDPRFTRDTILPMAQAAYAVFQTPGAEPALPAGYRKTALLEVDTDVLAALGDLPESASTLVETVIAPGAVFGLLGNNPAVKTAFVSFRGTLTAAEWLDNLDIATTTYRPVANFGQVHMGWMTLYETIRDSLVSNLAAACAGCDQLLVTGHSLGAALAVLAAPDILRNMPPNLEPKVTTFAGPRAGLHDFAAAFNMTIESCFRVVNQIDVVPHLPLSFPWLPYEHVGVGVAVDSGGPTDQVYRHSLAAYGKGLDNLTAAPASAV